MLYPNLSFPRLSDRPYFFSNFVQTLDGKVQVLTDRQNDYWPIGSRTDYQTLMELRAAADALVHGKGTALVMKALGRLTQPEFTELRTQAGKTGPYFYVVVSGHPDEALMTQLAGAPEWVQIIVATTLTAQIRPEWERQVTIVRAGQDSVDLAVVSSELYRLGCRQVLVEGGPHLMGSFVTADLIDEYFVTIAPKIFGGQADTTFSMIEGPLLPPEKIQQLELISAQPVEYEMYLRYRRKAISENSTN